MVKHPFVERRKLTGKARVISIPIEWFENNNIDSTKVKRLTVVGNEHLVILNPNNKVAQELAERFIKKNVTFKQLEEIIKKEVVF